MSKKLINSLTGIIKARLFNILIYLLCICDETNLEEWRNIEDTNVEGDEDRVELGKEEDQLGWKVSIHRKYKKLKRNRKNC